MDEMCRARYVGRSMELPCSGHPLSPISTCFTNPKPCPFGFVIKASLHGHYQLSDWLLLFEHSLAPLFSSTWMGEGPQEYGRDLKAPVLQSHGWFSRQPAPSQGHSMSHQHNKRQFHALFTKEILGFRRPAQNGDKSKCPFIFATERGLIPLCAWADTHTHKIKSLMFGHLSPPGTPGSYKSQHHNVTGSCNHFSGYLCIFLDSLKVNGFVFSEMSFL